MTKYFITFLLVFSFTSSTYSNNQYIKFRHLTVENGLSQSGVLCILQDKQGFMWIGTRDGLNRYDGYNFVVYNYTNNNSHSIGNSIIQCLLEDSKGRLWVGTYGGGLNLYDRDNDRFIRYQNNPNNKNSISDNFVMSIYEDSTGIIWVGTSGGGLNKFDPVSEKFTAYLINDNLPINSAQNRIQTITEDNKGQLWIGTWGYGLGIFDRNSEKFIPIEHQKKSTIIPGADKIWKIFEDQARNLWIGTDGGGVFVKNHNSNNFIHHQRISDNITSIKSKIIVDIIQDKAGQIWLGTDGAGLFKFNLDNNSFVNYSPSSFDPNSLSNNVVRSIYENKSGLLWVGTLGGISIINPAQLVFQHYKNNYSNASSLSHNNVSSVYIDKQNILWVGTDGGGLNKIDPKTGAFSHYMKNNNRGSISDNVVLDIFEDKSGILWLGTYTGGLNRFDPRTEIFSNFVHDQSVKNSISSNFVRKIWEDKKGVLWIGTMNGGLNKFDKVNNKFRSFTPRGSNSISSPNVLTIKSDSNGILWLGTYGGGLNKFDPKEESFIHFLHNPNNPNSISGNNVFSILIDNNIIWIGTNNGLDKYDTKKNVFKHYYKSDGLPNNVIHGILKEDNGDLWLSTNNGLSNFNPITENFNNFDVNSGLQGNEFSLGAYHKDKNGKMYFGGINGLNTFHPNHIIENTYIPPIVVTDFKKFNESVRVSDDNSTELNKSIFVSDNISLSYKNQNYSFEFASLDFTSPLKNLYAYKLVGLDEEWNFVKNRRFVTYTNLEPGNYTFKVKGSNHVGVWNEEGTSIDIYIAPPFYKTFWFNTLLAILIIGAIYSFYKYRTKLLRIRAKDLQQKIEEKTSSLIQEINQRKRIEDALRDSKEKYRYLVENINDVIFSIIKNGIVTYISPAIETVLGHEPGKLLDKSLKEIFHKEDWEKFEKRFDGFHSDKPITNEYRMLNKSQDIVWMRISEKPSIQNGSVISSQGVITDITERKMLEGQLVQAQKLESIGHLAAGVAHEINTPIQFIGDNTKFISDAFSDISVLQKSHIKLLDRIQNGEEIETIITEIKNNSKDIDTEFVLEEVPRAISETLEGVERVSTIIKAMKNFSHKGNEVKTATDINKIIESTIIVSRNEWKYVADLEKDFQDNLPVVQCLSGQFNQVILNLIINASHSISDEIETGRYDKGKIQIITKVIDGYLNIVIKDTGRGIPEEIKNKVFNPFFTTKDVGKGTGQGLSIAYDIVVNKHNGFIDFSSQLGIGTTFTIKLPIDKN